MNKEEDKMQWTFEKGRGGGNEAGVRPALWLNLNKK